MLGNLGTLPVSPNLDQPSACRFTRRFLHKATRTLSILTINSICRDCTDVACCGNGTATIEGMMHDPARLPRKGYPPPRRSVPGPLAGVGLSGKRAVPE